MEVVYQLYNDDKNAKVENTFFGELKLLYHGEKSKDFEKKVWVIQKQTFLLA